MIVAGYSMHIYCDHPQHEANTGYPSPSIFLEIAGTDRKDCIKQVAGSKWFINFTTRVAFCPTCFPLRNSRK